MTFFYKYIFPVLWFGALSIFVLLDFVNAAAATASMIPLVIVPVLMTGIGYIVYRALLKGLVDELWDNGNELLVINGGHLEHVPFSEIVNVSYMGLSNPKRATLMLRKAGRWGTKLSFIPVRGSISIWNLMDNKMLDELILRIDAARRAP